MANFSCLLLLLFICDGGVVVVVTVLRYCIVSVAVAFSDCSVVQHPRASYFGIASHLAQYLAASCRRSEILDAAVSLPSFGPAMHVQVSETGNTGLHLAAYCGRVHCLGYIVSHGGDLAKKNRHGQTPAMLALLTGRTEVLEWLLQNAKNTGNVPDTVFPEVHVLLPKIIISASCSHFLGVLQKMLGQEHTATKQAITRLACPRFCILTFLDNFG